MSDDPLEFFTRPTDEPATADTSHMMVVRARAKNSAEMEAHEQAIINGRLDASMSWPIPFYEDDDRITPAPLTRVDIEILRTFGVTADEWRALYTRERPLP
jgi:hypothetical protein